MSFTRPWKMGQGVYEAKRLHQVLIMACWGVERHLPCQFLVRLVSGPPTSSLSGLCKGADKSSSAQAEQACDSEPYITSSHLFTIANTHYLWKRKDLDSNRYKQKTPFLWGCHLPLVAQWRFTKGCCVLLVCTGCVISHCCPELCSSVCHCSWSVLALCRYFTLGQFFLCCPENLDTTNCRGQEVWRPSTKTGTALGEECTRFLFHFSVTFLSLIAGMKFWVLKHCSMFNVICDACV